ncbi:superoxide dismutase [Phenylobacterium sp.]|uniref:superoxide dismutase n=1 Tax=Phenylobacterium sp. TaxID=1871053 RepID=UPI002E2FF851|nr:superoxide dismutase [Phenylobacterium sp.]HEX2561316.1 superoxide dismutase [Phenylobacterium sp.]
MAIELPPLPYEPHELEPHVSSDTLGFHHGKHHKAYVDKTNQLIAGTDLQDADLETIIVRARQKGDQTLLNQSGQAWNHDFFWRCMTPEKPPLEGRLAELIQRDFGGVDGFKEAFKKEGVGHFASGWAWLVVKDGKLVVTSYHDGDAPVGQGVHPLLTCDVWEHAYYLDYQNDRGGFLDAFLNHLVNWRFAARMLDRANIQQAA